MKQKLIREVMSIDSVACWTDGYITVGQDICMVSLFGSTTRVNTMRAIILKGELVYLQDCWNYKNAWAVTRVDKKLKAINRQLAHGVAHCVIYAPVLLDPEEAFGKKIFFGDSVEKVQENFFYVAQKRYSTPFLPAGTQWLLSQMEPIENINALGFNQVLGVRFPEEEDLEARLFEAGSPLSGGGYAQGGKSTEEDNKQPFPTLSDALAADVNEEASLLEGNYKRKIDLN